MKRHYTIAPGHIRSNTGIEDIFEGKMVEFMRIIQYVIIAVLIAIVMMILGAVPPLCLIYEWAERNDLKSVWYGLVAGVIAVGLLLSRGKWHK